MNRPRRSAIAGDAGGECANPDCGAPILRIDKKQKVVEKIGQIAHIRGAKDGSNRYDKNQTDGERRHYDNLLILCPKCHTCLPDGVDIPANEERFPPELLMEWKEIHLEKIRQLNDRNWICHPNGAHLFEDGKSDSIKFWIDEQGQLQLYTAEQLVIVEQLFKLHLSFSQLNEIIRMIEQTEGKPVDPSHQTMNDAVVGQLYQQFRRLPKNGEFGWIGYLAESLNMAQDVTLGELHAMWVKDGLAKKAELRECGRELLKGKAEKVDPSPRITLVEK